MSADGPWGWVALLLLGAYHGINPGMGWLFAVARGMQQRSRGAVVSSLPPIALGHAFAIALAIAAAALVQAVLPLGYLKVAVAVFLAGLGIYRLRRSRHPRFGGMQVGFRDLTIWSFLMASAHGAGLMVLPVVVGAAAPHAHHHAHAAGFNSPMGGLLAVLVHTAAYLGATALVAVIVYEKVGVAVLRKAWFNLDFVWAIALIGSAIFTLLA